MSRHPLRRSQAFCLDPSKKSFEDNNKTPLVLQHYTSNHLGLPVMYNSYNRYLSGRRTPMKSPRGLNNLSFPESGEKSPSNLDHRSSLDGLYSSDISFHTRMSNLRLHSSHSKLSEGSVRPFSPIHFKRGRAASWGAESQAESNGGAPFRRVSLSGLHSQRALLLETSLTPCSPLCKTNKASSWSAESREEFGSNMTSLRSVSPLQRTITGDSRNIRHQESVTYEEAMPVIVRRRGCTMTVRIVSVDDVQEVEQQRAERKERILEDKAAPPKTPISLSTLSLPQHHNPHDFRVVLAAESVLYTPAITLGKRRK